MAKVSLQGDKPRFEFHAHLFFLGSKGRKKGSEIAKGELTKRQFQRIFRKSLEKVFFDNDYALKKSKKHFFSKSSSFRYTA